MKYIILIIITIEIILLIIVELVIVENNNINNNDNENNSIANANVVNSSIGENRVNLSNFLRKECVNIYVKWYRLYNFLLCGRDADIINFGYKKEWNVFV